MNASAVRPPSHSEFRGGFLKVCSRLELLKGLAAFGFKVDFFPLHRLLYFEFRGLLSLLEEAVCTDHDAILVVEPEKPQPALGSELEKPVIAFKSLGLLAVTRRAVISTLIEDADKLRP